MANYEDRETCDGEKIYLDEKLLNMRRVFYGHYEKLWQNSEEKTFRASEITLFREVQAYNEKKNRSQVFIIAGVAGHVISRMNRTPRNTTVSFS